MIKALTNIFVASSIAFSVVVGTCQDLMTAQPEPEPEYDYSQPVPASEQVEDGWFYDSAIIGHSLMEGFEMFSKVDSNIHYFTDTGISAARSTSFSKFSLPNGGVGTLEAGLQQKQFSKVYIMLGINEITISKDRFKENMSGLIAVIRNNQAEGIPIYVLNITPTTRNKSNSSAYNLDNIQRLNEAIAELCEEQECYLVDLYSCFADESGYLPANISTDGVHIKAPQYRIMADYILSHTVS